MFSLIVPLSQQFRTDYRKAEKEKRAGTQRINRALKLGFAKLELLLTFL